MLERNGEKWWLQAKQRANKSPFTGSHWFKPMRCGCNKQACSTTELWLSAAIPDPVNPSLSPSHRQCNHERSKQEQTNAEFSLVPGERGGSGPPAVQWQTHS
jgi:hypothetical protein